LQLTIEKLVYGGDGLSRLAADERGNGKAVFVPFVLSGERVEAAVVEEKRGFARAQAGSILSASGQRVQALCPYFQRCGGCHYQHASYYHQIEIKVAILKENLRRIAKVELDAELQIHPSVPWNYRNRTRLKVQVNPEFALGYYRFGSHDLLPVEQCPISSPLLNRVIEALWLHGRNSSAPSGIQEIEIFADAGDAQALIEIYSSPDTSLDILSQWACALGPHCPALVGATAFTTQPGKAETEPTPLFGAQELTYRCAFATYRVSSGAFFQVNRHLIDELIKIVAGKRSGETAIDLYAGVGLFSTALARSFAQVIAVESSPTSHADLRYNSPPNLKVVRATTEQFLGKQTAKLHLDFVVVDPPRSGLGEQVVQELVRLKVPRLTYVSCNPSTLARDLRPLLASGYRIDQAHLVDLFPQTYHLESVFHLAH
jgi:23S rRNA (uracil1939-C5)-methyltransferase